MGVQNTSDHIQIKIEMPNSSQEPPASSKAPKEELKDMDDLCTLKIKIDNQNWELGCIKDRPYPYLNQYKKNTKETPVSSKAPNQDKKDMDVLNLQRAAIWNMGISKSSDHIQITINIINPS